MTSLRTLVMGSLIILIGYAHISNTTAALGHLSQASAAHDQTDRPPREAATDGICDQPRPQYAFGADQSTHQLISIAQFHAMPVDAFTASSGSHLNTSLQGRHRAHDRALLQQRDISRVEAS